MFVGDPSVLAIESSITRSFKQLSQRALGFFVLHVGGNMYGVRSPEATMLACSFDEVRRRIAWRGRHVASFGSEPEAGKIIEAVHGSLYVDDQQDKTFFEMSTDDMRSVLADRMIVWAPDGDAAFDDGGHVLQFDVGDQVRLIAFKNRVIGRDAPSALAQVWMPTDAFYSLLDDWQRRFEAEWAATLDQ